MGDTSSLTVDSSIEHQDNGSDKHHLLLQFSGQGNPYFSDLRQLYLEDRLLLEDFFTATFEAIQEQFESKENQRRDSYFDGFRVKHWLEKGAPELEAGLVANDILYSAPLVFAFQIINLIRIERLGITQAQLQQRSQAIVGHSLGLNAALFTAQKQPSDEKARLELFKKNVAILFWLGYRSKECYQKLDNGEYPFADQTSPMLIVRAKRDILHQQIERFHSLSPNLQENQKIVIGLQNLDQVQVVCGVRQRIAEFSEFLKKNKLGRGLEFLATSCPFHTPLHAHSSQLLYADHQRLGFTLSGKDLLVPVYCNERGSNLRDQEDLSKYLAEISLLRPLNWPLVLQSLYQNTQSAPLTHSMNFGPSRMLERLAERLLLGTGIRHASLITREAQMQFINSPLPKARKPWLAYAPKIIEVHGKKLLSNAWTDFTGRPPIFGGGMTPTTVEIDLSVVAANSGWLVEWAGGGQVTEEILLQRLDKIRDRLADSGAGIVMNLLYLDAYLWNLQNPMVIRLKKAGYPIDGVTISAGVPDVDEALKILQSYEKVGLWLNSFKPGTNQQINNVILIAKADPKRRIIMQVEGGAAGGHHSWEALSQLMIDNYAKIRSQPNIILAVGGGIASPEDGVRWLLGTWNEKQRQPVDAVFLGTRLMACKEAHTSVGIKQELVELSGGPDFMVGKESATEIGGIISGKSGLGADIHYARNHWSETSAWLEKLVKGRKAQEAQQAVQENRQEIIERLNRTTKPFFGSIEEMTYAQVLSRFVDLVCPGKRLKSREGPWPDHPFIDSSYRSRLVDLIMRFENRFANLEQAQQPHSVDRDQSHKLDRPTALLEQLFEQYPQMQSQYLLAQDCYYFYGVCAQAGKPVNFIPLLDENIVKWYRSDSLWYAHCDAVVPNACAWIPGPEAVQGISKVDESVTDVFLQFETAAVNAVAQQSTFKQQSIVRSSNSKPIKNIGQSVCENAVLLPKSFDTSKWKQALIALCDGCIAEFLQSCFIISSKGKKKNILLSHIFHLQNYASLPGQFMIQWLYQEQASKQQIREIELFHVAANISKSVTTTMDNNQLSQIPKQRLVKISVDKDEVDVSYYFDVSYLPKTPLMLSYSYQRKQGLYQPEFHERKTLGANPINTFYRQLWHIDEKLQKLSKSSTETEALTRILSTPLRLTGKELCLLNAISQTKAKQNFYSPLTIVMIWNNMLQTLLDSFPEDNILELLHLSHVTEWSDDYSKVMEQKFSKMTKNHEADDSDNDDSQVRSYVQSVQYSSNGKEVTISGDLYSAQKQLLKFSSTFFIRGSSPEDKMLEYRCNRDESYTLCIDSKAQLAYFYSITDLDISQAKKDYLQQLLSVKSHLDLCLQIQVRQSVWQKNGNNHFLLKADFLLPNSDETIAKINRKLDQKTVSQAAIEKGQNPIFAQIQPLIKENEVKALSGENRVLSSKWCCPHRMHAYAEVSLDYNPIHTEPHFASLAGLDFPIVHGMYNYNQALLCLIEQTLDGNENILQKLRMDFHEKVNLGENVYIDAAKKANCNGGNWQLELKAHTLQKNNQEQLIAIGEAVVRSPKTVYFYTGQGSQYKGMGMNEYAENVIMKKTWDEAEAICNEELGFSLLHIVRDNPNQLRVGGVDYFHPEGVLNLTQFTQVAIVVKSLADWRVLEQQQVVPQNYYYCGHSLGEYVAVASQGIMSLGGVVNLVYSRGQAMQNFVERDEQGRSSFAMSVVLGLPKIGLDEKKIIEFVQEARQESKELLEIVNFNIRNRQYSVTGTVRALEILEAKLRKKTRGHRTFIRLKGIDVPFHSSHLLKGVETFRKTLDKNLPPPMVADYERLDQGYIPNLVALPFAMNTEFLQAVYDKCKSPNVQKLLSIKNQQDLANNENRRHLLIELLCYQFAMPVLWIQTQELLFLKKNVRRVIEIGPRGDLSGMARQTIRNLKKNLNLDICHLDEKRDHIYGLVKEDVPSLLEQEKQLKSQTAPEEQAIKTKPVKALPVEDEPVTVKQATPPPAAVASSRTPIADCAPSIKDGLLVFLAIKAQIRLDEISLDNTIENIFQGNSSKRNQALADLGAEFATNTLEGAHEKTLHDLIEELKQSTSYSKPGPYLRTTIEDFIKSRMPAGFGRSEILKYLQQERLLGDGHCLGVSMYLPVFARSGRSLGSGDLSPIGLKARLASKEEALEWLATAVDAYGEIIGQAIPRRAEQGADSREGTQVSSEALLELEAKYFGIEDGSIARLLSYGQRVLFGIDPFWRYKQADRETLRLQTEERELADWWQQDHGKDYAHQNRSLFDSEKIVWFKNSWQWTRKNIIKYFWKIVNDEQKEIPATICSQIISFAKDSLYTKQIQAMLEYLKRIAENTSKPAKTVIHSLTQQINQSNHNHFLNVNDGPFEGKLDITDQRLKFTETYNDSNLDAEQVTRNYRKWMSSLFAQNMIAIEKSSSIETKNEKTENTNRQTTDQWRQYLNGLLGQGIDLRGRSILVTGAGKNSIALEVVQYLLRSGATVIISTTTYNEKRLTYYKRIYQENACLGASLAVVPFSQGSVSDCQNLVRAAFAAGYEIDCLLPFAAIGEENSLTGISVESTSTFRVMLLGIQALISELARQYRKHYLFHKKFQVLLPLSPNHGTFGRDGLYAEMKLALEALLEKWFSENDDWGRFCSLTGCRIGWVRGTGLMELNDIVVPALEEQTGCKTFHRKEMALLLFSLIGWQQSSSFVGVNVINLAGKLDTIQDLKARLTSIRTEILEQLETQRELHKLKQQGGQLSNHSKTLTKMNPLANPWRLASNRFPQPPSMRRLKELGDLSELEKSRVVCVVGFGEVSPGGSSRTRWELEKHGLLSLEAAIELAWMMGYIDSKRDHWIDCDTQEKIEDWQVKEKYEQAILEHTGIRIVEPELNGFDPRNYPAFTDVILEEDFMIPMGNEEEAYRCQQADRDHSEVYYHSKKEQWYLLRKKGSIIKVQKAMHLARYVAGQIPSNWNPERYGFERSLIEQVDRVSIFAIVAVAEAFIQAGMSPTEVYRYLHPAEVGSTLGGGMGGMQKLKRMFQDHRLDQKRQHDVLQETLINVTVAWAITSLIGSIGPIQTPVAACATAGISVEMALGLIEQRKARFVVAGGFDELGEEGMLGFGDMDATANNEQMAKQGIPPHRMSRPNDVRRAGFIEAQGGGVVLLTTVDLVLEMGLPVRGIIAYAASHTDGFQASIPAPGLGLVAVAREHENKNSNSLASLSLEKRKEFFKTKLAKLNEPQLEKNMREQIFHDYWKQNPEISPLRGALGVFNLKADDIAVVFKHDTSTSANDPNENRLHHEIQQKMGRHLGNPLLVVSQKSSTGHSKGGAAAWQLNGLLQSLREGVCSANKSLQDIDSKMDDYPTMLFTDETIYVGEHRFKAGILTSLGFGHVGVLILALHPDFFYAMLNKTELSEYLQKLNSRQQFSYQRLHNTTIDKPLYQLRQHSLVSPDLNQEVSFYLDSESRTHPDKQ